MLEPPITDFDNEKDSTRFYFPHDDYEDWDDWGSQVNSDDIPVLQFHSDIRANDYYSLFNDDIGLNWYAEIKPFFLDTLTIDDAGNSNIYNTVERGSVGRREAFWI